MDAIKQSIPGDVEKYISVFEWDDNYISISRRGNSDDIWELAQLLKVADTVTLSPDLANTFNKLFTPPDK